jgi:hypothetical protein
MIFLNSKLGQASTDEINFEKFYAIHECVMRMKF